MMDDEKEIPLYAGSGNVFADLGLPDAEEALARLAQQIKRQVQEGCNSGENIHAEIVFNRLSAKYKAMIDES
ncbi:hypothetical protein [Methylomagnum ishizawai]|uniref:hypothetical protein n=1 Tax=Methylomagnum ishizawai TaxID=1760988 RepID=UPI001C342F10|nr:hypothetical protein [Methylomagnum ishizawai]BBL77551.1 hypothetical protein MishRS11D_46490 [Methylomagnum ishizawai]